MPLETYFPCETLSSSYLSKRHIGEQLLTHRPSQTSFALVISPLLLLTSMVTVPRIVTKSETPQQRGVAGVGADVADLDLLQLLVEPAGQVPLEADVSHRLLPLDRNSLSQCSSVHPVKTLRPGDKCDGEGRSMGKIREFSGG